MNDDSSGRDLRISNLDVIQIWNEEKERFDSAYTDNISRSGLFVLSRKPLPLGSKVRLKFTLVKSAKSGKDIDLRSVDVRGEVIHRITITEAGPGMNPGMGIRFIDLPPDAKKTIDDIISSGLEPTPSG